MFSLQNYDDTGLQLSNLEVEEKSLEFTTSKYDLSLYMSEVNDKLQGSIEYSTDLFSAKYIEAMIENFKVLLKAITDNSSEKISQYPLLSQEEEFM